MQEKIENQLCMFKVFLLHLLTVLIFYCISSSVAPLKYAHSELKMININKVTENQKQWKTGQNTN